MPENYVIWILGVLSFAVGGLTTTMFRWRREIDKDISDNRVEIAKMESIRRDVERLFTLLDDLTKRVAHGRERRLLDRRRTSREIDDMEND